MFAPHNLSDREIQFLIIDTNGQVVTKRHQGIDDEPLIFNILERAEEYINKNHRKRVAHMTIVSVEKII